MYVTHDLRHPTSTEIGEYQVLMGKGGSASPEFVRAVLEHVDAFARTARTGEAPADGDLEFVGVRGEQRARQLLPLDALQAAVAETYTRVRQRAAADRDRARRDLSTRCSPAAGSCPAATLGTSARSSSCWARCGSCVPDPDCEMLGSVPASTEATLGFDAWMRDAFRRDGYLALPDALPEPVIARWRERAHELFERARDIERTSEGHVLSYRVLTGEVVKEDFGELYDFYMDQRTLAWVATVTGEAEIHPSPNLMSAVNVNILQAGHRYRWHFDANPYTALLYLSTSPLEAGGELELYPNLRRGGTDAEVTDPDYLDRQQRVSIRSRAGMLVLIDGSVTYHRVAPVLAPCDRVSVPMVFPPFREELRPAHLDAYLYASS